MNPLAGRGRRCRPAAAGDPPGTHSFAVPLGVLAAVGLSLAGYWSLRLGLADWLSHSPQPESKSLAARLAPGNTRYLIDKDHERGRLNPYDSSAWIRLGLNAELAGDLASAESFLLRASEVDKTYLPRWTLANYYFRRFRSEDFWLWARRAAEMAYLDQSALFDLCWRMSPDDPATILRRAIPDRTRILAQYLGYLLRHGRLEAAVAAARRLLPRAGAGERGLLLACCNRLLDVGQAGEAIECWNGMAGRALIPYQPLDPSAGASITNGDFASEPLSGGFDWRMGRVEGVAAVRLGPPDGIRLKFSGGQPERCTLMAQVLPVVPEASYRLRFEGRFSDVRGPCGLAWVIHQRPGGPELGRAPYPNSEMSFRAPPGCHLALLSLVYERAVGTTRIEGAYDLRRVVIARELSPSERPQPGLGSLSGKKADNR